MELLPWAQAASMRARKVVVICRMGSGPKAEAPGGYALGVAPGMVPGIVMGWADAAVIEANAAQANATRLFMTIPLSRAPQRLGDIGAV